MIPTPPTVTVVDHPVLRHTLTQLRDRTVDAERFRHLVHRAALLLGAEATRDLPLDPITIDTPLETRVGDRLGHNALCLVSILRAGNGLLDGMLDLLPFARVGHIGLARDHETLRPVEYYLKLPDGLGAGVTIVVDPMLATGHSAGAAIARVKQAGATRIRFVCLLAAPEGLRTLAAEHPDVPVIVGAIDRGLDEFGYIRPGLGDAGDRIYGTGVADHVNPGPD